MESVAGSSDEHTVVVLYQGLRKADHLTPIFSYCEICHTWQPNVTLFMISGFLVEIFLTQVDSLFLQHPNHTVPRAIRLARTPRFVMWFKNCVSEIHHFLGKKNNNFQTRAKMV